MIALAVAFTAGGFFGFVLAAILAAASRDSDLERIHHYQTNHTPNWN